MDIQNKIKNWIKDTLKIENGFVVEHPADLKNGDYSTNVAMSEYRNFAKAVDSHTDEIIWAQKANNPAELAKIFAQKLNENKISEIEKVEAVGGFINFYLSKEFFEESIQKINELGENVGDNDLYKNQKIIIEYTDPNPFKEFHIGHLMSNSIGESISRIIEVGGSSIKRLSYGGDVGLHVAKSIFTVLSEKEKISEIKNSSEKDQIKFWAESYVSGNRQYEENPDVKEKIDNLNKIIFDKTDSEINDLYEWGRNISIKYFEQMFKRLGTHFDKNIWESDVTENALNAVELGFQKNILEKSEGAIIFRGENFGLHTRVFINSKGVPLYEAKELGLGIKKYEDYTFDKSIVITGNEQNEYFKVVLKATELIKPEVASKTIHRGHGMLRFASGKMSSRKGNVITAEDLLEQVRSKIYEKIKDRELLEEEKENIAEVVAIGAIKYSILRQAIGGDIIFDFDKSISFEGDSGPYLQYTAVRAKSVLEKSKLQAPPAYRRGRNDKQIQNSKFKTQNWETAELERHLYKFGEVVERAGREYAPHYIVTYLTELAGSFNAFYAKEKIMDENDTNSPYKLAITSAVFNILKKGLHLLAIKVPERM